MTIQANTVSRIIYSVALYRCYLYEVPDATESMLVMALYLYCCDYTDTSWHLVTNYNMACVN